MVVFSTYRVKNTTLQNEQLIVNQNSDDFWVTIGIENIDWQPIDTISKNVEFRMRPKPSLATTWGTLYFYNKGDAYGTPIDSIRATGGNGSSNGYYSVKYRFDDEAFNLSSGEYSVRFKQADSLSLYTDVYVNNP